MVYVKDLEEQNPLISSNAFIIPNPQETNDTSFKTFN